MSELILTNDHRYFLDGKPIDGLTSTIQEAGLMGNYGSEWYMDRGTAVHLATELWDKGTLDESTVDPQIQGYFNSWITFRKDQNYTPLHIEFQIYHPQLMVGMKIDRLRGPIDLKSAVPAPWHILQVACHWATLKAYPGLADMALTPMDVYLDPDGGPPKIKIYSLSELREAFKVYCSMLHFIRWRREKYGSTT